MVSMISHIFSFGASVALALSFALIPQTTQALSCIAPMPNAEFIAQGGVIFHGTVVSNTTTGVTFDGMETRNVVFRVSHAWGGTRISSPFTVTDTIPPASGFDDDDVWGFRSTFEVGGEYTVHAEKTDTGIYSADIGACARSTRGFATLGTELGSGYVPEQTTTPPSTTPPGGFQSALIAQIQELLAIVADLQARLFSIENGGGTPVGNTVADFDDCVAETGIVLESYPRKCIYDGVTYIESLDDGPTPVVQCPNILRNLGVGMSGSDVSALQTYLQTTGDFRYPEVTAYYGPATEEAVRIYQCREMGVCFGRPDTTGYGFVGPQTRTSLTSACGSVTPKPPVACTLEYAPQCGAIDGVQKTYGNSCQLNAAGAQFVHSGECRATQPTTAPDTCRVWNDGCNVCSRTTPGGALACTKRACIWQGVPMCEVYFDTPPVTSNDPVIHSFTGPTVLAVREPGVWSIEASDPQNGAMSYKVDWGDQNAFVNAFDALASLANSGFVQQTTFTHSYAREGTYTISITARDAQGLEARTTTTVRVGGDGDHSIGFTVSPSFGSAPLTTTATITLPPRSGFDTVEVCGPIGVGEISWGDGQTSRPTRLGCSSQRVVTAAHTYQSDGTYTVRYTRTDGQQFTQTVRVGGSQAGVVFVANPTVGGAPLTTTFSVPGGTSCLDGPDYKVNFGDGREETTPLCSQGVQTMTHTYQSTGTYYAKLYEIPSGFAPGADTTPRLVGTQSIVVGGTNQHCTSGGQFYAEGTQRTCITTAAGAQQCIADAQYVCRSGSWEVEAQPWGPSCVGGSNYGGGFYEDCDTPSNNLSVYQPSGGFYRIGDDIRVRWTTNVQHADAAMYIVLEDEVSGRRYKSMKVDRGTGQATINTGSNCNAFFSDGIDGDCSGLRQNSFEGNVRYVIRAVIYTPANACFGFCAPGSVTNPTTIIQSESVPFTLGV